MAEQHSSTSSAVPSPAAGPTPEDHAHVAHQAETTIEAALMAQMTGTGSKKPTCHRNSLARTCGVVEGVRGSGGKP